MCRRLFFLLLILPQLAMSSSYLFFLEAQGVGGYSWAVPGWTTYSHSPMMAMQSPSIGFDYLQRLTSRTGDWGSLGVQFRLAWKDEGGNSKFDAQVYNLFFKIKRPFGDFWLGHDKPAFGLGAVLDTHGRLIQTLTMDGFGFERDWGAGYRRDFSWGSMGLSLTSGSGMDLRFKGNHLLSARLAWGVLERDNVSVAASLSTGRILPWMGHGSAEEIAALPWTAAAFDLSHRFNQFENRFELMLGRHDGGSLWAFDWLGGMALDAGERWRLETQAAWWRRLGMSGSRLGLGLTWQSSPSLAWRTFAYYEGGSRAVSLVFQVYFYRQIWF